MVRFVWLDITYTVSKNVNSPRISYAQTKKKKKFFINFFWLHYICHIKNAFS